MPIKRMLILLDKFNEYVSINDNDYKKASLLQKTTAACQLIDKSRLVSGQTTANVGIMGYFNAVTETREAIDITYETDNE